MALNTFKCDYLTPLHFKVLKLVNVEKVYFVLRNRQGLDMEVIVCVRTLDGTNALTLVFAVELVCVAMAAAEGEGHTATKVVIVVPPGDWDTTWSWVHWQRAHTCTDRHDRHQLIIARRSQ